MQKCYPLFSLSGMLLVILTSCISLQSPAQDPPHSFFTVENGLISNHIYDIFFDSGGEMWLGTEAGLCRFDGYEFTRLSYAGGELPVSGIAQSADGRIFALSFDGRLLTAAGDSLRIFPVHDYVRDYRIVGNDIHVLAMQGLSIYQSDGKLVARKGQNQSRFHYFINDSLAFGGYDEIYDLEGLMAFSASEPALRPADINGERYLFSRESRNIYRISENTTRPVFTAESARLPLCGLNFIKSVSGSIFYGSYCGLGNLISGERCFKNLPVSDLEIDFEGNYWVSTLGEGLIMVPFPTIMEYANTPEDQSARIDKIIPGPRGAIFAMGSGNIYSLDQSTHVLSPYYTLPETKEFQGIMWDEDNQQFLMECNGFYALKHHPQKPAGQKKGRMNLKSIQKFGQLFFIRAWHQYHLLSIDNQPLPDHWITDYLHVENSVEEALHFWGIDPVWNGIRKPTAGIYNPYLDEFIFGYTDSSYCLNKKGLKPLQFQGKPVRFSAICIKDSNEYLLAGGNCGVLKASQTGNYVSLIHPSFFEGRIPKKADYRSGILWLMFTDRLLKYNTESGKAEWLDAMDGFSFQGFNDFYLTDSAIYVATTASVIEIPVGLMLNNEHPPRMASVSAWSGKQIFQDGFSIEYGGESRFVFNAVNYRSRGRFQYYCRLNGYENDFRKMKAGDREAVFGKLPSGSYTFEIFAENGNGVRSVPSKISFTVIPPFWQSWWFFVLCGFILIAAIILIIRWVLAYKSRTTRVRNIILESRLNAIKKQMNPHFIFNCLASIQELVLSGKTEESTLYLGRFSKLLRKVMEHNESHSVSLRQEIDLLSLYLQLEGLRMGDSFHHSINIDPDIDPELYYLPPLLIQPYVENAVRHGLLHKSGSKQLKVSFLFEDVQQNTLVCLVEDNGIGRNAAEGINANRHRHKSYATRATESRMNIYRNKFPGYFRIQITDKVLPSGEPAGTCIKITLPAHFS